MNGKAEVWWKKACMGHIVGQTISVSITHEYPEKLNLFIFTIILDISNFQMSDNLQYTLNM